MSDYASFDDPYCYKGTFVLKSKAGLRHGAELQAFELEMSTLRAEEPLPRGRFGPAHFRAIHRHLFGDVYAWAGRYRTVRTSKGGNVFCYPEHIDAQMNLVFARLRDPPFTSGATAAQFVKAAAAFLAELNAIHAFREGNGRAQLAFLALDTGGTCIRHDQAQAEALSRRHDQEFPQPPWTFGTTAAWTVVRSAPASSPSGLHHVVIRGRNEMGSQQPAGPSGRDVMRLIAFTSAFFVAIVFWCRAESAAQSVVATRPCREECMVGAEELKLSPIGSCIAADGPVDMSRLWYLENRSVGVPNRRIQLLRQSVGIELLDSTPPTTHVYDIPWMVSDEQHGDPDIELKLVLLDGQLAVYWRETYQHRHYRQGLFRVEDARLVRWCEGMGGIYTSH